MFGLFGKKKKQVKTISRIGLTRQDGFLHLLKEISPAKKPIFVFYYFEESKDFLKGLLTTEYFSFKDTSSEPSQSDSDVYFINARTFNPLSFKFNNVKTVYCLDHYPLYSVFTNLASGLSQMESLPELIIYGGIDEPILNLFGGEKIGQLMKTLGIRDSEMVEHEIISTSIGNAQKKIEKKVLAESKANSAVEWFKLNYSN